MPTVLRLRFPGRRYHATPWGHHVNEGLVEWPPAPWRLLRALLSTGFTKLGWEPTGPPPLARALIERLAPLAPDYHLPRVTLTHSRHYVDAAGKKPLIMDAWAHFEADAATIEIGWDLDLPLPERALLQELARHLCYLGRAESWVVAELADQWQREPNCRPAEPGASGGSAEILHAQLAVDAATYADWRARRVAEEEAPADGKKKGKKRPASPYPADLLAALCVETGALQAQLFTAPPGSRVQRYLWTPPAGRTASIGVGRDAATEPQLPTLALLSLTTLSRSTSALPPLWRAFPQGRILHRALASVVGKQFAQDADLALRLLGKDLTGALRRPHQHAHLIHCDLGGLQRLDHALVYVPMGLTPRAEEALRRVRRTYMKGGAGELQVALAAIGDAAVLRRGADAANVRAALDEVLGPPGGARAWVTETPYVAPWHITPRGQGEERRAFIEAEVQAQVRRECERRGLPALESVELLRPGARRERPPGLLGPDDPLPRLRHFVLHDQHRDKLTRPPYPQTWALVLRFAAPVEGPLCMGYGAHAGLGRFRPYPLNE